MALPVLDGNQTATTLSSVVTGGEHIVAHTVVSLGSTAISNITSAVSGSVVSVSNFPSTQTIAGTVTANVMGFDFASNSVAQIPVNYWDEGFSAGERAIPVLVGNEFGGLNPANPLPISGTVTANVVGSIIDPREDYGVATQKVAVQIYGTNGLPIGGSNGNSLPISGTVTVGNSVTIGSLPAISGTVTANSIFPRVTFIDGSGTVATANTAITVFASSSTRSYLLVQVTTGSAFVNVGATATTVNGINLTAGQGYAWETTIPQGIVSLISTTTSSRYVAKEA